jgi:hypothetical protein
MKPHLFVLRSVVAAAGSVMLAASALAQRQPLVLQHGVRSGDATWSVATGRLQSNFPVEVKKRSLTWTDSQTVQARELRDSVFASLPDSTVAIGHSNGGIVLRQAVMDNVAMRALMTIGSPNWGAPAATAVINGQMSAITGPIVYALSNFGALWYANTFDWEEIYYVNLLSINVTAISNIVVNELLASVGFDNNSDVWQGLYQTSPFLQNLNSVGSLNLLKQRVPVLAAVATEIDRPEWALYRLAKSESQSEDLSLYVDLTAVSLFIGSFFLADRYCGYYSFDSSRCLAGLFMGEAGYQLQRMPHRYCAVAQIEYANAWDPYLSGAPCLPGDALSESVRQTLGPRTPAGDPDTTFSIRYVISGVSHTEQTKSAAVLDAVESFLQTRASLPRCGFGPVFSVLLREPLGGFIYTGQTKIMDFARSDRCGIATVQGLPVVATSSNSGVASVAVSGNVVYVYGSSPGTAEITVSSSGFSETRVVTIVQYPYF